MCQFDATMGLETIKKFVYEKVNLVSRDVGHDHYVGDVLLACELPSLDKRIVHGAFQDDS